MQRPSTDQLVEHLRTLPVFRELAPEILAALAAAAVWRVYAAGAVVFLEDEPSAGLHYLHSGWLKAIKMSPEGREQTLQFLGAGEVFNYVGVFGRRANPATVIALEPSGVWLLRRDAMQNVLAANPQAALHILEAMADRLVELIQLVSDLSLRTVEARLARQLLTTAEDDVVTRQRWATQTEIAARLGTVPDVISRAMRNLVQAELIQVERNAIRLLDRARLTALADTGR